MTPLSPEAVAQMVAYREAGTPGPWKVTEVVDDQIHVHAENRDPNRFSPIMTRNMGFNDDVDAESRINARRIARLPDLEAAYLTFAAENATLRAERDALQQAQTYSYIGKDMKTVKAVDLENERDALLASEAAAMERVKAQDAEIADLKSSVVAFCGPWAAKYAEMQGLAAWELHPTHYDILEKCGARMVDFRRAALTPTADKEPKT